MNLKLRVAGQSGLQGTKHVAARIVTRENPGGYREDQGYNCLVLLCHKK